MDGFTCSFSFQRLGAQSRLCRCKQMLALRKCKVAWHRGYDGVEGSGWVVLPRIRPDVFCLKGILMQSGTSSVLYKGNGPKHVHKLKSRTHLNHQTIMKSLKLRPTIKPSIQTFHNVEPTAFSRHTSTCLELQVIISSPGSCRWRRAGRKVVRRERPKG